jgi:arylsulfatase A-like enzyme
MYLFSFMICYPLLPIKHQSGSKMKLWFLTVFPAFMFSTVFVKHLCAQNPFDETVRVAAHLEPAIPRAEQSKIARGKLAALRSKTGRPPNILVLLVDDMGWGDIGANGGGVVIGAPTPNIDKLAQDGLRLTSVYAQSTCTPSRAALMTGRFPSRTGLTRPLMAGEALSVNPWSDEDTAARLLSAAGYRTALSGKWHLGEAEGTRPHEVGYDEYLGILGVASEMTQAIDARIYPDLVLRPERREALRKLAIPEVTTGKKASAAQTVKEIKTPEEMGTIDQMFADYSANFIQKCASDRKPFYLIHAFSRVHNDNYPAPGYAGKSPAGFPYKDAITEVDDIVGRLIRTLKETGQLENTLVFFTSDNGANEDVWPDSGFQPWRGGKGTTWEGGVRVPGIAYWPGMISPRPANDGLFDLMDLFNTSLAIAGISDQVSNKRYIDGIDQSSFLLADDGQSSRQAVFMYGDNRTVAMRWKEYKIHTSVYLTHQPMRNLDESVLTSTGDWPWVYNLYMDPKEQRSTGHRYFEWGFAAIKPMLTSHIATYFKYPRKSLGLETPR